MKYKQLVASIESANDHLVGRAVAVVNQSLVLRNWIVGAYIVEFEQGGEDRAAYGEQLLSRLAADLKERGIKGMSPDMLERMRLFYSIYPQLDSEISAPLVRKLGTQLWQRVDKKKSAPVVRKSPAPLVLPSDLLLRFSWSQIIELIRGDDPASAPSTKPSACKAIGPNGSFNDKKIVFPIIYKN